MCGIAGYFGNKNLDSNTIQKTLSILLRRGPDDQNYKKYENFYADKRRKS